MFYISDVGLSFPLDVILTICPVESANLGNEYLSIKVTCRPVTIRDTTTINIMAPYGVGLPSAIF